MALHQSLEEGQPLYFVVRVQVLQYQLDLLLRMNLRTVGLEGALPVGKWFVRKHVRLRSSQNREATHFGGFTKPSLAAPPMNSFSGSGSGTTFAFDRIGSPSTGTSTSSATLGSSTGFGASLRMGKTRHSYSGRIAWGWTLSRSHSTQLYTTTCPTLSANCWTYRLFPRRPPTRESLMEAIWESESHSAYTSKSG